MKYFIYGLITTVLFCAELVAQKGENWHLSDDSGQLVVVIADSPEQFSGKLWRFEKAGAEWKSVAAPIDIVIGKKGLGWGKGLHPAQSGEMSQKREGDGKSPAGVFALSSVFGFAELDSIMPINMPYVHVTELLECVDDAASQYYNTLVDNDTVAEHDWHSSEKMMRVGEPYHLGVFVDHNVNPIQPGAGSCIFLHIWGGADDPTIGCTAMPAEQMDAVVSWLKKSEKPLLVQLPKQLYSKYQGQWHLPEIAQ